MSPIVVVTVALLLATGAGICWAGWLEDIQDKIRYRIDDPRDFNHLIRQNSYLSWNL